MPITTCLKILQSHKVRYSIKLPIFITVYFVLTVLYTWAKIDSEWMNVFWACYKNLTLVACFYFIYKAEKILWTDKIFLLGAIIINVIQTLMYPLCPLSTSEQKIFYFDMYGWFVVLTGVSCIILYINELLWRQP